MTPKAGWSAERSLRLTARLAGGRWKDVLSQRAKLVPTRVATLMYAPPHGRAWRHNGRPAPARQPPAPVEDGGHLGRDYLDSRDSLSAHAEAAREFAELKVALAARFPRDREAYIDGKTARVREILILARRER